MKKGLFLLIFLSCTKINERNNVVQLEIPVKYYSVFWNDDTTIHASWYDLYEYWHIREHIIDYGHYNIKGKINLEGKNFSSVGFNVYDEQSVLELKNTIEQYCWYTFSKMDNTLKGIKSTNNNTIVIETTFEKLYDSIKKINAIVLVK